MADNLRVGVIGLGSMGRNHARVYSDMPNVDLVGLADVDSESGLAIQNKYGGRWYADYRKMLVTQSPDVVSIAVPTSLHHEVGTAAMSMGINALIEKPLALTVAEGKSLVETAKKKGVHLGVGHVERFNPVIIAIRQSIANGDIGVPLQVTIRRFGPRPARMRDVGVFLDLATHDIDIMCHLTQSDVVEMTAESITLNESSHEDIATGTLRLSNGTIGVFLANWVSPTKIRDVMVNGETGMLVADTLTQDLYQYDNDYTSTDWLALQNLRGMAEGRMIRHRLQKAEPLLLELEAFCSAVRSGNPFEVSGEDGLRAVDVAIRMRDIAISRRTGMLDVPTLPSGIASVN